MAVNLGGGKIPVLYLSSSSGPGGAERVLCSLAASLDRTRFRPIVGLFRAGWLQEQCENLGIETHIFPSGGFLQSEWIKTCVRLVRHEQIAIIHAHEFDANVHGTVAAFLARTPIVATIHGKHYYWTALRRRLAYRLISRYATVVAVSHDLKEFVAQEVGIARDRITVVHNGVNPLSSISQEDRDCCRVELGIPPCEQVVGAVGSLYPVKGHRFLIDAVPQVLRRFPDTTFLIIGRGELEAALKEQAERLGVASKVMFLGLRQDVPRLLAVMDIFALPSLSEGLSMAVLEAMTAGKPIVATRVGGNPELVEEGRTGLLVESQSSQALVTALELMLGSRDTARQMGACGREKARREYGVDGMVRQYVALYQAHAEKNR